MVSALLMIQYLNVYKLDPGSESLYLGSPNYYIYM